MSKRFCNKKGISLVFVMVVAMALVIFSAVLFTALSRSLNLTGQSIDDRQTYLTAKSAIEYAKTVVLKQAKGGSLQNFVVKPDGGGFTSETADGAPDGTNIYASCTNTGGDVKISAMVKDKNSDRCQKMNYTFHLEFPTVSSYFAAGTQYGTNLFLHENGLFAPDGDSDFPVLIKNKMTPQGTSNSLKAPEIYLMKGIDFSAQSSNQNAAVELNSKFIYVGGDLISGNTGHSIQLSASSGIIWFNNVNVTTSNNLTQHIKMNGIFKYDSSISNLFDKDTLNNLKSNAAQPADYAAYSGNVSYFQKNYNNIYSGDKIGSGGVGWTNEGGFIQGGSSNANQTGKDIYLYVDKDKSQNDNNPWSDDKITYTAKTIAFHFNGDHSNPFVIPGTKIFIADTIWLNEQSQDGAPSIGTNISYTPSGPDGDDVFQLKAKSADSHFYVYSTDGKSDVKIILPHALRVLDKNGNEIYHVMDSHYDITKPSSYTYTVPYKTDLFAADASAFKLSGSGGSGGSGGGFTISGGKYAQP